MASKTKKASERAAAKSHRRSLRTRALRSRVKTETKKALQAAASAKPPEAQEQARTAVSTIDKAATKGAIHRNKAARLKSRVMKRLAAVKG